MRFEVTIPGRVFDQARRAAIKAGVSLDRFVSDAVSLHVEGASDGPRPTPEIFASLRKAEADMNAGKGLTMEQVDKSLAAKKAAWFRDNLR